MNTPFREKAEEVCSRYLGFKFTYEDEYHTHADLCLFIEQALESAYRLGVERAAEIAREKEQEHTGFAGNYDAGAMGASRMIRIKIEALLPAKKEP